MRAGTEIKTRSEKFFDILAPFYVRKFLGGVPENRLASAEKEPEDAEMENGADRKGSGGRV